VDLEHEKEELFRVTSNEPGRRLLTPEIENKYRASQANATLAKI